MPDIDTTKPQNQPTIESYIKTGAGGATITWYNFSILQPMEASDGSASFQLEEDTLVNDYMDILLDKAEKVTMSQEEQKKYFYNPELLSYDLYDTTEFDFLILKLNGIIDPKEFDMESIKLVKRSDLINIMSDIYNAERKYINANREKYNIRTVTN